MHIADACEKKDLSAVALERGGEASECEDGVAIGSVSVISLPSRVFYPVAPRVTAVQNMWMPCPFVRDIVAWVTLEYRVHGLLPVDRTQIGALHGFNMLYVKEEIKGGIHELLTS